MRLEAAEQCPRALVPPWRCAALQAKHILVAVGGRAVQIPIEGAEHSIISDDILELEKVRQVLKT